MPLKMKRKIIFFSLLISALLVLPEMDVMAQGKPGGGPPPWAPANGYRAKTRYVYFPDHNFYFDLNRGLYIFMSGSSWTMASKLPPLYSKVNLKSTRQVELDFYSDNPHRHNKDHLVKHKGKGGSNAGPAPKPSAKPAPSSGPSKSGPSSKPGGGRGKS
jgi:hypothetical protein